MKYFLLLTLVFFSGMTFSQNPSCCASAEGEKGGENKAVMAFASFAEDDSFQNMHPDPKPLNAEDQAGEMVEFETSDGFETKAYYVKGEEGGSKYLFVIHEWWGLNDHIKAESDRLHEELGGDVHVIALDMYEGMVATTKEGASKLMQSVDVERARGVIGGAIAFAGQEAEVATIGWCFGGGWSMQTTLELGNQAAGCVIYYGMPEDDLDRLNTLEADVLGIFASKDKWINDEVVAKFAENMEAAGKNLQYEVFDAEHAFANPSRDSFSEGAANEANSMAVDFIKRALGL